MLAVQIFELSLAQLWLAASYDARTSNGDLREQMERAVQRSVKAFQRMSAGALQHKLVGKIDADLIQDIEGRIAWRNILAHRYLRERLRRQDGRIFKVGTLAELERLTCDFEDLSGRLEAECERLRARISKNAPEAPPLVDEVFARLAREVIQDASHEPEA